MSKPTQSLFSTHSHINWLAVKAAVNAKLGTNHSANFCYQVHTGRQSSETVRLAIVELLESERRKKVIQAGGGIKNV